MASSTRPQSSAVSASGPSLSSVPASGIAPCRLTRPYVGRSPLTPQYVAGPRIEPQVSEPIANGRIPAPTAEPEPLEEPPLHAAALHGETPGPVNEAFACR